MAEYITGTGQTITQTHPKNSCEGEFCVIHNPSRHVMVDYPTNFRGESGLMERICPCGVGHPDPDSLAFFDRALGEHSFGVHGCCSKNCCIEGVVLSSSGEFYSIEDDS